MAFSLGHWKLVLSAVIVLLVFYVLISLYSNPVKVITDIYKDQTSQPSHANHGHQPGGSPTTPPEELQIGASETKPMPPRPHNSCTCVDHSTVFKYSLPTDEYEELKSRRVRELQKHKARTQSVLSKLLFAAPNSPLQYPIQGFTVRPLTPTIIPGLQLHTEDRKSYRVTLKVTKGVLTTKAPPDHVNVVGSGTNELIIESNNTRNLSHLLTTVTYTSTIYHVNTGDRVSFTFENHEAVFSVTIREPQVPVLYDMGNDINSQVTILTKTFIRYPKLRVLLSSIRKFYSNITIIIADDSLEPEKVTGEHIQHYIMPPAQGWFAGRNLAVSQVTTKYFLWVDDDFEFTEDTKIEKMVEVMEKVPDLDVLGGTMKGHKNYFTVSYEEGNEIEGGCLDRKTAGRFQPLPGHPGCFHVSGVVNFFLARTDAAAKVRFDPKLQRVAHSEFFFDGFGSLMVASCSHVTINHQPKKGNTASYSQFRRPGKEEAMMKERLHFFKNNLRCIRYG